MSRPRLSALSVGAVSDLPRDAWTAATPDDFFFDLRFLRVMEESRVEDAAYRYVLMFEDEEPVGAAVLSHFLLRLDLLSGDPWVRRVRRIAPQLLDVPIICCGIPASFGQHHLHVTRPRLLPVAATVVHGRMEEWARETRSSLLLWKEWSPTQRMAQRAKALGYVVLPTLPDHTVGPLPPSVEEFLGSMRSPYRRKFRRAAELMAPGPAARRGDVELAISTFGRDDVASFFRGYAAVLNRTEVRLEAYPLKFFSNLAESDLELEILELSNRVRGERIAALVIPSGDTLCFILVAKEHSRYHDSLYPLLLQCIVLHAIQSDFRCVRLGQTSSYSKVSVGAEPRRLETFIRASAPVKHRLLERFGPLFFPEVTSPELRVFRNTPHENGVSGED